MFKVGDKAIEKADPLKVIREITHIKRDYIYFSQDQYDNMDGRGMNNYVLYKPNITAVVHEDVKTVTKSITRIKNFKYKLPTETYMSVTPTKNKKLMLKLTRNAINSDDLREVSRIALELAKALDADNYVSS